MPAPRPKAGHTKWIVLIVAAVILVPLIGIGAWAGGRAIFGGGIGATGTPPPVRTSGPVHQVQAAAVEQALASKGFRCYDAIAQPSKLSSCYRTAPGGVVVAVRLQPSSSGEAVRISVEARPFQSDDVQTTTGSSGNAPLQETSRLIADAVLGPGTALPELQSGNRTLHKDWGTVQLSVDSTGGRTSFVRAGQIPAAPTAPALPRAPEAIRSAFTASGYDCTGSSCTKDRTLSVEAKSDGDTSTIAVKEFQGGPKTTPATVRPYFRDLVKATMGNRGSGPVDAWVSSNLHPTGGIAEADVSGVHVTSVQSSDGTYLLQLSRITTE